MLVAFPLQKVINGGRVTAKRAVSVVKEYTVIVMPSERTTLWRV